MTNMFDIFDKTEYETAVAAGFIRVQKHPDFDYFIHNYTDQCTWEQAWNDATLNCRGLITDANGEIIARGMPKFFNSDQEQAPKFALDEPVVVTDKMDGSLGIMYLAPEGKYYIATRGSFASEQALYASTLLNGLDGGAWAETFKAQAVKFWDNYTPIFEIIYPENRIVVDYGEDRKLVCLGLVNNTTGTIFHAQGLLDRAWYEDVSVFEYETWQDVLTAPTRDNAEGFVVHSLRSNKLVKIKYDDYKRLHKYMTRVTERHVWEVLMNEGDLEAEFAGAPDEFHDWVRGVAARLHADFEKRHLELVKAYRAIMFGPLEKTFTYPHVDEREAKKNFAMAVKDEKDKAYYFLMYEDRNCIPMIWKELKPEANTFKVVSSDAD